MRLVWVSISLGIIGIVGIFSFYFAGSILNDPDLSYSNDVMPFCKDAHPEFFVDSESRCWFNWTMYNLELRVQNPTCIDTISKMVFLPEIDFIEEKECKKFVRQMLNNNWISPSEQILENDACLSRYDIEMGTDSCYMLEYLAYHGERHYLPQKDYEKPLTSTELYQNLEKWCNENYSEYGYSSGEECFDKEKAIFDPRRAINESHLQPFVKKCHALFGTWNYEFNNCEAYGEMIGFYCEDIGGTDSCMSREQRHSLNDMCVPVCEFDLK